MKLILSQHSLVVVREETDPKIYSESQFLYQVKLRLIDMGFDVIKKLMHKDGHLVSDKQHYVRDRKWGFAIYDPTWALRSTQDDYNRDGQKTLSVEHGKGGNPWLTNCTK